MVLTSNNQTVILQDNIIEVDDLEFNYGSTKAVDKLSFSLAKGEILGLIGKNGAGKTTTIHLLLGLLKYRKGKIRVLGNDPRHDNISILNNCGFFPEQGEPYEWMRIAHFFKMGQYCYSDWDRSLCSELSEQLELDIRKRISDLSKGMLIKAKLIFAMAHRPEILVLDEPTNGLDPLSRYDIMEIIRSLAKQHNVSVLISSHNLDEVAGIATQICIVNNGKKVFSSSMDNIKSNFALIEVPSEIEIPKNLSNHIIMSKKEHDRIRFVVNDKSNSELGMFIETHGLNIELKSIDLKELFIFITRGI